MVNEVVSIRPRLIPSTRFLLAILLCLGFIVQYAQRINLSIAIVCMIDRSGLKNITSTNQHRTLLFEERKFHWNEWNQQVILGSYWIGYLLTLIPSGWFSITLGAKIMAAAAIFTSSLATIAFGSIYFFPEISFPIAIILRILIGAAHGVLFPVTYTLWAQWAVPTERGTLSSVGFCGTNIGTSLIVVVGGLFCRYVNAGWIHTILLSGIIGFLWLPLWFVLVSDTPGGHKTISSEERDYIQSIIGTKTQTQKPRSISLMALPWKEILRSKPVIGLFFSELCNLFGLFFFLGNLGKILTEIQKISSEYTGYILACGFLFMLIGNITSGVVADKLVQKNMMTLTGTRKLFNSLTSFLPALSMILLCFCDETQKSLGIFAIILFLFGSGMAYGSGYVVNYSDIVPAYAGLMFGIGTSISSFGAVVGNLIAGIVLKRPVLEDWRKLFILFFIAYVIGGLVFLIWGSGVPEKWATLKKQQDQSEAKHEDEIEPMKDDEQDIEEKRDINA